jgi:hypothetical protein
MGAKVEEGQVAADFRGLAELGVAGNARVPVKGSELAS